jgi:hypothetical protein
VLDILPFLTWLAAITSVVLLVVSWKFGELRRSGVAALVGWFLVAAYCQFFGGSPLVSAVGLFLQTMLAILLMIRWRLRV